jgi:AraC-like DNA-binding protein/uncharacterized RmlC-like cupin family protein
MELIDISLLSQQSFYITGVTLGAGIRPKGRVVDHTDLGRRDSAFVYVFSGEMSFFESGGGRVVAGEGDLVYIPSGLHYKMVYTESATHFSLLNLTFLTPSGTPFVLSSEVKILLNAQKDIEITSVFRTIEIENSDLGSSVLFRRRELAYRLLHRLYRKTATDEQSTSDSYKKIAKGISIIEDRYLENISIESIAYECFMSVSLFRKLFFEHTGSSPVKYRNKLRIDRASALLSEGDLSVAEVAELSGFSNSSYFCRLYKRMTGHSPTDGKNPKYK